MPAISDHVKCGTCKWQERRREGYEKGYCFHPLKTVHQQAPDGTRLSELQVARTTYYLITDDDRLGYWVAPDVDDDSGCQLWKERT